jgi:hypothetical protein
LIGLTVRRIPVIRCGEMNARLLAVLIGAAVVAIISARPTAGGWNDGSRLATVECLVDHGTWAIDDSIFIRPNGPYPTDNNLLADYGTLDRLRIDGHFYSDKSPVPAMLMAGEYGLLRAVTGWTAAKYPQRFCWLLCVLTSGLAYVVAVWSMDRLGRIVGLPSRTGLALTASFALATVAPAYVRQVNNHVLLLGVTAALLVELLQLETAHVGRLLLAGWLAGLAYTIDLGVGPIISLGAACLVAYRRRWIGVAPFAAAALPWILLHHGLNYAIGGTLGPANANLEYLNWPGSPFNAANATGGWSHPNLWTFLCYAVSLLVGLKGFLNHNLMLMLAVPAAALLVMRRVRETPEIVMASAWAVGTWLLFAVASSNSSGLSCSIRWFVPLLAPGCFVLAVLLRDLPERRRDFAALSVWGAAMAYVMWQRGPWMPKLVPHWWAYVGGGLLTWGVVNIRRRAAEPAVILQMPKRRRAA